MDFNIITKRCIKVTIIVIFYMYILKFMEATVCVIKILDYITQLNAKK